MEYKLYWYIFIILDFQLLNYIHFKLNLHKILSYSKIKQIHIIYIYTEKHNKMGANHAMQPMVCPSSREQIHLSYPHLTPKQLHPHLEQALLLRCFILL